MAVEFTSRRNRVASTALALPVKPAPIEDDDEQRYKPIEWPLVKRLLQELKPFRAQYALGISIGLVQVLLDLLGPQFIRQIINYCTDFAAGVLHVSARRRPSLAVDYRILGAGRDGIDRPSTFLHSHHDPRRRNRAIRASAKALRASARAVDELLRQDQARPDHQPLHQRHQCDARSQCLGHLARSSPTA